MKPSQAVDAHAHVFSAEAPAVAGARYRPAYGADLSAWRAHREAAGISHGVVVQPSFFGSDNREMLDTVASDPRHLRGVAVMNPIASDARTLAGFHAAGVRAIRLNLKGVADYATYATAQWRDLFERIGAHGWHVETYVDTGRLPEMEPAFAGTSVALVFDHFGTPGPEARSIDAVFASVKRLAATRDVWVKLSAPYRLDGADPRQLAARWLDAVGPERIVWGSDWPFTGHEAQNEYARRRADLDDWIEAKLRTRVLWDNAARLYQFD